MIFPGRGEQSVTVISDTQYGGYKTCLMIKKHIGNDRFSFIGNFWEVVRY